MPRFILRGEYSINAKLLYALLLGRTQLSQKSGWVSEDGNVYVIYTIRQMANDLNRSERTVKAALDELENAGLITRVRQGWNRANRIFLQLPDEVQLSSRPEGNICTMDGLESSPCMGQNLPISKKEKKKTDSSQNNRRENARRCFGQYQNIFLLDSELADLQSIYPGQYEDYINRLSAYMASSGKHYANHYATIQYRKNGLDKHPIACKCAAEERARREAEQRELERLNRIAMLRSEAFRDIPAAGWRFENAEVMTPQLAKARAYSENWDAFRQDGTGLLLFGNVGTGKSYAAGCIANALIERMVSVLFVGLSDVVNRMQGNFGADRDAYMKMLMRPELLILDDLGAERNTSFGRERVFDVVNKRLLTGKPMIVTTNIPLSVMQKAADLDERRIYDRVLEVCVPIQFNGENFRKGNAAENVKRAAKILNQGT